jgi:polysaccharide biosynthesis transport protein
MNNPRITQNQGGPREDHRRPYSINDYFKIIKNYSISISIIFILIFGLSAAYAFMALKIYKADTTLRITPPEGNILTLPLMEELGSSKQADEFIANEIHILNNITIREKVAEVIIDSFKAIQQTDKFSLILNDKVFQEDDGELKSDKSISKMLKEFVSIKQIPKLNFIEISCESPSPFEAALITNVYANVYKKFNLLDNRKLVTRVRGFLEEKRNEKYNELKNSENKYKIYQLEGGGIKLDAQAENLITTMTELESRVQSVSIDLSISRQTLVQYKAELEKQDLSVSNYLKSKASEPLLLKLQMQIAELQAQKEIALLNSMNTRAKSELVERFENKIISLNNTLSKNYNDYENTVIGASPQEIKILTQKIFEEEVKYNALNASHVQLKLYLDDYTTKFDKLPEKSIDLARLERQRLGDEKLYTLIEEKYQEALINEQATSGNILILNSASIPESPYKPLRIRILLIGLSLGLGLGLAYAIIRNMLDSSIKNPDDLETANIEYLTWIPLIENFSKNGNQSELLITNEVDTVALDAFNSLRTLIRYSNVSTPSKVILLTSSVPSEGKSFVSLNLARSFAMAKNKTLIIDCDLRKPRVHKMLGIKRFPGFTDYLVEQREYEDLFNEQNVGTQHFNNILKKTDIEKLYLVTAGTIPPNPTEILDSMEMKSLLEQLKNIFDVIIIDSPPLLTFADSIILSRIVDRTILVAEANNTEMELVKKSVNQLKKFETKSFIGVLLNKFDLKNYYGSYYYNYAYNYSENGKKKKKPDEKKKLEKSLKS